MRCVSVRRPALLCLAMMALMLLAPPNAAAGTVMVENRSAAKIKVVATGGSAEIDAGAAPQPIPFDADDPVGPMLRIWWAANPRELCMLLVPWDRLAIVTGTAHIRCRSE